MLPNNKNALKTNDMKVIRQVGKYSLVDTENTDTELRYYVDNGDDVTEYFDKTEVDYLDKCCDIEFADECFHWF